MPTDKMTQVLLADDCAQSISQRGCRLIQAANCVCFRPVRGTHD